MLQGFKAQLQGDLRHGGRQRHLGLCQLTHGHQQLHIVKPCVVIGRVDGQGLLQLGQGRAGVALGQQGLGLAQIVLGHQFVHAGQMLVQKLAHLALGQSAHEAIGGLAILEQDASGDGADAKGLGQLLFVVRIDLDQLEATAVIDLEFFQNGAQ